MKSVPLPSMLFTSMVPFMVSTICCVSDSEMLVPRFASVLLPLYDGSKICGRSFAAMPIPVSAIFTTTLSPSFFIVTMILPPRGVNFRELEIRLAIIFCIKPGMKSISICGCFGSNSVVMSFSAAFIRKLSITIRIKATASPVCQPLFSYSSRTFVMSSSWLTRFNSTSDCPIIESKAFFRCGSLSFSIMRFACPCITVIGVRNS